jgi:hypothetical protein
VGIAAVILLAGRFGIKMLLDAPPDPDPADVVEVAMDYRCSVCGLHLTVTRAHGEDIAAPRHCHEEMEEAL